MPTTILIAEDEKHTLQTLCLIFRSRGYRVIAAANGEEALAEAIACRDAGELPNLLLTDVVMPLMNGVELIDRLREEGIDLPVVCLTGFGDRALKQKLQARNCRQIVDKPCRPEILIGIIERLIEEEAAACGESLAESRPHEENSLL
ncbi:MAG TPA: response regulator [Candidatus Glassbacteria bacterium]|nr:response regulator [Candidatus Glassbacteria bacterium]